ncbi:hypothetical protein M8818_005757 [Zalaria obscura]|uniref:Uncharacterized protein n=1 Tax=Zalaria obscura TaxID=2024903 RepID=A0ACC3S9T0_9PEZI
MLNSSGAVAKDDDGSRARSPAGLVSRGKRVTPSGFTTSPYLAPGESDCGSMALSGCCGHALVVLGRNSPGATGLVRFIETARVARPLQTVNATRRNVVTLLPRCFHEKPLVHRTQLVAVEILLAACDMPANSRMDRNYITRSHDNLRHVFVASVPVPAACGGQTESQSLDSGLLKHPASQSSVHAMPRAFARSRPAKFYLDKV